MSDSRYTSGSQQRILKLISLLSGHEFNGISPGELAKAAGISPSAVTRDLSNLKTAGFAENLPHDNSRWRLGPRLVNIGLSYLNCRDQAESRMQELTNRYGRNV